LWQSIKIKNAKLQVTDCFQDGCRRHVVNSSECYKMGKCRPFLIKFATQTKRDMLSLTITKAEVYGKKHQKLNVESDVVIKRQRCMSAKL
jgi:hypothetical protein